MYGARRKKFSDVYRGTCLQPLIHGVKDTMIGNARRVVQAQPTTRTVPMTHQHCPVQVPHALMRKWLGLGDVYPLAKYLQNALKLAAQWGYDHGQAERAAAMASLRKSATVTEAQLQEARDQQLDEFCKWLQEKPGVFPGVWAAELRDACRPKVDDSEAADAARMRWMLQGSGCFMEEHGLCGHGPCDEQEMNNARREIDKYMARYWTQCGFEKADE